MIGGAAAVVPLGRSKERMGRAAASLKAQMAAAGVSAPSSDASASSSSSSSPSRPTESLAASAARAAAMLEALEAPQAPSEAKGGSLGLRTGDGMELLETLSFAMQQEQRKEQEKEHGNEQQQPTLVAAAVAAAAAVPPSSWPRAASKLSPDAVDEHGQTAAEREKWIAAASAAAARRWAGKGQGPPPFQGAGWAEDPEDQGKGFLASKSNSGDGGSGSGGGEGQGGRSSPHDPTNGVLLRGLNGSPVRRASPFAEEWLLWLVSRDLKNECGGEKVQRGDTAALKSHPFFVFDVPPHFPPSPPLVFNPLLLLTDCTRTT